AKQFASVLQTADKLFLMPIYPAGEKPIRGVSSASILNRLKRKKGSVWSWETPLDELKDALKSHDVFLTLGAGDVWKVGEALIKSNHCLAANLSAALPELSKRVKSEE